MIREVSLCSVVDKAFLTVKVLNKAQMQTSERPGSIPGGGRYLFCYCAISTCQFSFSVAQHSFINCKKRQVKRDDFLNE